MQVYTGEDTRNYALAVKMRRGHRVYIQDGMNEGPRRGQGGEEDHRPERSISPWGMGGGHVMDGFLEEESFELALKGGEASNKQR